MSAKRCCDHDVEMITVQTKFGWLHKCYIKGCTVTAWDGSSSVPANQNMRDLRKITWARLNAAGPVENGLIARAVYFYNLPNETFYNYCEEHLETLVDVMDPMFGYDGVIPIEREEAMVGWKPSTQQDLDKAGKIVRSGKQHYLDQPETGVWHSFLVIPELWKVVWRYGDHHGTLRIEQFQSVTTKLSKVALLAYLTRRLFELRNQGFKELKKAGVPKPPKNKQAKKVKTPKPVKVLKSAPIVLGDGKRKFDW